MQLWATTLSGKRIYIDDAVPGRDYYCLECTLPVRMRTSVLGLNHFFHIACSESCRQSARSKLHIDTQKFILNSFPKEAISEEVRFPEIGRVADIAYFPHKCIFEVQCSWIDRDEAVERTRAYQSIGWSVIWILSLKRFGGRYATGFEEWLQGNPHYFFEAVRDQIIVYDMHTQIHAGKRRFLDPGRIPISTPLKLHTHKVNSFRSIWQLGLKGDFVDRAINDTLLNMRLQKSGFTHLRASADEQRFGGCRINAQSNPLALAYAQLKKFIRFYCAKIFKMFS